MTLYSVVTVKRRALTHVAVNGGMADNLEPMIYGQRFAPAILDRERPPETCELVGHHCESGDILAPGVVLATPEVGDLVVMPVTGAYCYSLLNNYNGTRQPPVVFVPRRRRAPRGPPRAVRRPARPGRALTMTPHPLDPLGADEIRAAAAILRRDRGVGERWRFASIELREPSKATVRTHRPGDPIAREADRDLLEPRRRAASTRRASRSARTASSPGSTSPTASRT